MNDGTLESDPAGIVTPMAVSSLKRTVNFLKSEISKLQNFGEDNNELIKIHKLMAKRYGLILKDMEE